MSKPLRFALVGAGFWAEYQLAAWKEVGGVECVAVYNRTSHKARQLSTRACLQAAVYDDVPQLFESEDLDFVDIVTSAETHGTFVHLAAQFKLPVICQKPMATSVREAESMVESCSRAGVPFFVHENWRWQAPLREVRTILDAGLIGTPYRARLRMASGFAVFENQPFLKTLKQFLLIDMGSHILDLARFLFGEPASLYCCTQRVQPEIQGEDVATVLLRYATGAQVNCEMGYAGAPLENDHFPQTSIFVEGNRGSLALTADYWIRVTTSKGTEVRRVTPPHFAWADPAYDVVHASIVPCHANLLAGLRGERQPETTAEDNLRTVKLVFAAYDSAERNEVIWL